MHDTSGEHDKECAYSMQRRCIIPHNSMVKTRGMHVIMAQGRAGQGRAGQGRAGQGRAGQGRAGQKTEAAQSDRQEQQQRERSSRRGRLTGRSMATAASPMQIGRENTIAKYRYVPTT